MQSESDLDDLLLAVLERPVVDRPAFLDSTCGTGTAIRTAIERLLREHDDSDPFLRPGGALEGPFGDHLSDALAQDEGVPLGERIGPYEIISELGRGGMAVVYLAARADGVFSGDVALKVVKRGIDTDEVLTRFRLERQILASLAHPGIGRLIDGGETPDGRPYFVMELVRGEPIDRFCDRLALDIDARVDLCLAVARAVQHAHRHLVVHRDLKPSNILVTADGEVRLVDFGIAKLLGAASGEHAVPPTRTSVRILTPDYASPEQMRGAPITTGSDVYQLGLILFELLTGRRAQSLAGLSPAQAERVVCEQPVPRPSAALQGDDSVTRNRRRRLRGDLDNIVLMAVHKDPARRYGSVDEYLDDLVRYREGRAVRARGDALGYRAGKFVRRHRRSVAAAAAVVALVAAIVATYSVRIAAERNLARREAATATQVASFVTRLFVAADPNRSGAAEVTARELLRRGAERIDTELADQPEVQARMMTTIGRIYRSIGLLPEATALHARALATRREGPAGNEGEIAESLTSLAGVLYDAGNFEDARKRYEEAVTVQETKFGPNYPGLAETLSGLGLLHRRAGRIEMARDHLQRALAVREQAEGADHFRVAVIANNLGLAHMTLGDRATAQALFERALRLNERELGPDSPLVAGNLTNLGQSFRQSGDLDKAQPLLRRAVAIHEKAHGPDHRDTATAMNELGNVLTRMKRYDEARTFFERAEQGYTRALGATHPYVAYPVENQGIVFVATGDYPQARALFERALAIREAAFGDVHRDVAQALEKLGPLLVRMGDCGAAVPVLARAADVTLKTMPADHAWLGTSRLGQGSCAAKAGRYKEAEPLLLEAHRILLARRGADDVDTIAAAAGLAAVYEASGRPDEAARYRTTK